MEDPAGYEWRCVMDGVMPAWRMELGKPVCGPLRCAMTRHSRYRNEECAEAAERAFGLSGNVEIGPMMAARSLIFRWFFTRKNGRMSETH